MAMRTEVREGARDAGEGRNAVTLCGRLSADVEERTLPSGDVIVTSRVTVDRDASLLGPSTKGRQRSDAIDIVVWAARVQRTVRRWQLGDVVKVEGAIRRRFFTGANGTASRVEVEVTRARRVARPSTRPKVAVDE